MDSISVSYTYDGNGNLLITTDDTGTTIRTYDSLNRVLTKTVSDIGTISYEYDIITDIPTGYHAEMMSDFATPAADETLKIYDKAGRLYQVVNGTETTTYEYYANGNRQRVILPNFAKEEYTYYNNNLLWTLTNKEADDSIMDSYTYTYDAAGNQTLKYETVNGVIKGTTTYTYDALNRLETVTEPSGRLTSYTYDAAGNRSTETVTEDVDITFITYNYNTQNRLLSTVMQMNDILTEMYVYSYDNNGNMIFKAKETMKEADPSDIKFHSLTAAGKTEDEVSANVVFNDYDVFNRLIKTTVGADTVTYLYNAEGLRVEKDVNGQITKYLYEYDRVIVELDGTGTVTARNVYGTNLLMRTTGGDSYYYLYNGHGDVTALIATGGNEPSATYYYDAFGNILESTGNVNNPYKYSGYIYDEEINLYYLNARYYDSKIARFLSEDIYRGSANNPLSLNLYTYCFNNPIIYWDPTGNVVTEWDRQNCTPEQIAEIEASTQAWLTANAIGDVSGMNAAHARAEAARQPNRNKNEIGSASGYTYVIDSNNTATLNYYDQTNLVEFSILEAIINEARDDTGTRITLPLNGSTYIPDIQIMVSNVLAQSGSSLANEDLPPGIPSPAENGYYKPTNEVNSSFIVSKFVIEGKDYTGKILVSNPISFTGEILKKEIIINSIINKAEYKGYEFRLYEENGQLLLKSIVFTNNPEDIWVHKDTLTNYEAKWLNGFFDAKIFSYYSDIASAFTETGNEFAVMVGQLMQIPIVISESINAEQYYIDVKGGDLYFDIISQQNASYEYPIVMRHYITKEIEIVECSKHIPYYMQNVITLVGR